MIPKLSRLAAGIAVLLVVIVLIGCSSTQASPALGQEFSLPLGETVKLSGEKLSLNFDALTGTPLPDRRDLNLGW